MSGFGAGFDDFLMAQEGSTTPQQAQQTAPSAAAGGGGGLIDVGIPGLQANPPPPANNSGVDQGFLDFLSGQEAKTNANQTPQTTPEVIPIAAPTPEVPPVATNQEPTAAPTTASPTITSEQTTQAAEVTSSAATGAGEQQQQQQSSDSNATTKPVENETLREIKEKFGGRWKLVRSDPYDEYLKSTGVGLFNRQLAARGYPEQVFRVEGDEIFISTHTVFHSQNYTFKLNEETQNLVEKESQSVFCSYKDGKLILQMTPVNQGFAKVQEVERSINERGEHVVVYTYGENTCRRYFQRVMTVVC